LKATEVLPSPSPTIARSTLVSGAALPELQPASAAPVEQQAYVELEEPRECAAAPVRGEPRASAAAPTRMEVDPSCLEQEAWNATDLANLTPRLGFPGDYRRSAAASDRSERVWR
jgi:hypothetical protein